MAPHDALPNPGQIVRVRTRQYAVEEVSPDGLVCLACVDQDAEDLKLETIWSLESDAKILGEEAWQQIGKNGFDNPAQFGAYLHTLRWNCVTATDPTLFQSPFRAGIKLEAYQLEPLKKALKLPRVNMFIADDVGLGKTIEAGLIATELLLRRRVREIVVACPPAMLPQWRDELESRFGLTFEILDRAYIDKVRQERGYGVNPWTTFPRFLISYHLLTDETYVGGLKAWLDNLRPRSLFIFDEAHHAAPASGAKYAIDSRITKAIRQIAPCFEHRLFLSATPHNGHSNSFSALLELLDPDRFTRGVPVIQTRLNEVMVRRLKEDIRQLQGGFPKRRVVEVKLPQDLGIDSLPEDHPELALSRLLDEYREVRQRRVAGLSKRKQAETGLLTTGLQQRLLSSIEAFARTLAVHQKTMQRIWDAEEPVQARITQKLQLTEGIDSDDPRAELSPEELTELEVAAIAQATAATASVTDDHAREKDLLDEMAAIANRERSQPDLRIQYLLQWIAKNMKPGGEWNNTRIIVFTEYEATLTYIQSQLLRVHPDAALRIELYRGSTSPDKRSAIKTAFNADPKDNPLRILLATDAAREGLNLQAHCSNLFHYEVPWNPSRMEQRNGRIDRKLQEAEEVFCHYFINTQRPEDRIIAALVRKTDTIRRELGCLADVLESRLTERISGGIIHSQIRNLESEITDAKLDTDKQSVVTQELESVRERKETLQKEIEALRGTINKSKRAINFDDEQFRDAIDLSLRMMNAGGLAERPKNREKPDEFELEHLATRFGNDPEWVATLDTLRELPEDGKRDAKWRREKPLRPVIFRAPNGIDDQTVQLHLEHRLAKRLLGRFLSQGFVYHDLSRACVTQGEDAIPRLVLLGRLSLYGEGATRLHEEILTVTARYIEGHARKGPLTPYGRETEEKTLELLERAISDGRSHQIPDIVSQRLLATAPQDVRDLLPHLESRGAAAREDAQKKLRERGLQESTAMFELLIQQQRQIEAKLREANSLQFKLDVMEEQRQLDADRRHMQTRLEAIPKQLEVEPARILQFYEVVTHRIEPLGLAYIWPETG